MAITITSTGYKSQFEGTGPSISLMTLVALVVLGIVVFASGGLWVWEQNLVEQRQKLDQEITGLEQKKRELTEQRKEAEQFRSRLTLLEQLFDEHLSGRRIFEFLQAHTIPDVQWERLGRADFPQGSFSLAGRARGFTALARQIIVFADIPEVLKAEISGIGLIKGVVGFSLNLVLQKSVLLSYQPDT